MNLEIESGDVIKVMLQYLKEHNLLESMQTLQRESGVTLNTVDNVESFTNDIRNGKWDSVLAQTAALKLPGDKLAYLYEQVVFELLEAGERDLAKVLLRTSEPLIALKTSHLDRYIKLEQLCKKQVFTSSDAYELGSSKEQRRVEIAESLKYEISVAPPSRLLALLGQALKYQKSQNLLVDTGNNLPFDLFHNNKKSFKKEYEELIPKRLAGDIYTTSSYKLDSILFSMDSKDNECLITGNSSGSIEIYDIHTLKLRTDLEYQNNKEFISINDVILCITYNKENEYIAIGSKNGYIHIYQLSTSVLVKTFPQAHPDGITSITFSKDNTQLLTTSFDQTARIHGMKSGRALKEFRGHTSYVNCALYTKDSSNTILTGSADGTVKLWDLRSTECLLTYRPGVVPGVPVTREIPIHTLQLVPGTTDQIFVGTNSAVAYIMTTQGQLVRRMASGKQTGGDFICATLSPQGKWLYCVGEDGIMYIFDTRSGQLENVLEVSSSGQVLSITHHPYKNLIATTANNNCVHLWKP